MYIYIYTHIYVYLILVAIVIVCVCARRSPRGRGRRPKLEPQITSYLFQQAKLKEEKRKNYNNNQKDKNHISPKVYRQHKFTKVAGAGVGGFLFRRRSTLASRTRSVIDTRLNFPKVLYLAFPKPKIIYYLKFPVPSVIDTRLADAVVDPNWSPR